VHVLRELRLGRLAVVDGFRLQMLPKRVVDHGHGVERLERTVGVVSPQKRTHFVAVVHLLVGGVCLAVDASLKCAVQLTRTFKRHAQPETAYAKREHSRRKKNKKKKARPW
jgi:hypothetical protein